MLSSQVYCTKCEDKNFLIECKCECGGITTKRDRYGDERSYIYRHFFKVNKFVDAPRGRDHHKWKGKYKKQGYVIICCSKHRNKKYLAREHILVYEMHYNCCILRWGAVHHKNRIRDDNRFENLELMSKSNHSAYHNHDKMIDMSDRRCSKCGTHKTYLRLKNGKRRPYWHNDNLGGYLCHRCYRQRLWYSRDIN